MRSNDVLRRHIKPLVTTSCTCPEQIDGDLDPGENLTPPCIGVTAFESKRPIAQLMS